jgi:hypothetical protein
LAYLLPYRLNWTRLAAKWAGVLAALRADATSVVVANQSPVSNSASPSPVRLTLAAQWARLSGVVSEAIGAARTAEQMQFAATQQLDLAQYALSTLVDELAAVMTIPGRRDQKATVHVFGQAAARASAQEALAA